MKKNMMFVALLSMMGSTQAAYTIEGKVRSVSPFDPMSVDNRFSVTFDSSSTGVCTLGSNSTSKIVVFEESNMTASKYQAALTAANLAFATNTNLKVSNYLSDDCEAPEYVENVRQP